MFVKLVGTYQLTVLRVTTKFLDFECVFNFVIEPKSL